MAGTQLFKNTGKNAHRRRYMTSEDQFSKGMQYTDNPLSEGYVKAIVNFDLKNDGKSLTPRPGFREYAVEDIPQFPFMHNDTVDYFVHHTGAMYIATNTDDAVLCNYILVGRGTSDGYTPVPNIAYVLDHLIVENPYFGDSLYDNKQYFTYNFNNTVSVLMKPAVGHVQGFENITRSRVGIHAAIDGNTYILAKDYTLRRLDAEFVYDSETNRVTGVSCSTVTVDAKEVQPTQAMNYGYNMLKSNPYSFANVVSATGAVQLTGVVPYDEQNNLLLTARPGTPMVFKLYYKYPQFDVDNTNERYLVQWEIQDLNNSSDATIIQKVRNSTEYIPGDAITLAYTPSFKAFSIIVRLYKKTEIAEQDAAWEQDQVLQKLVTKDANLTPNQVTTLASYYLTSNSDTSMLNVTAVNYNICNAKGMCAWQQRLVLWGVEGAKSTLFVSEINDPTYFPYPNNCEIFTHDIVCAVPYLSSLLVFTTGALYKLTLNDDGLSYKSECIQERLAMTEEDANTVVTSQNMVYFKSGNYFYMVVPNNSLNSITGMQIAPVSRPVEQMLDNLPSVFKKLLTNVYGLVAKDTLSDVVVELKDYSVYTVNTQIRNIYKIKAQWYKDGISQRINSKTAYFDICINYDTVLRAWTVYLYQSNQFTDVLYKYVNAEEYLLAHLFPYVSNARLAYIAITKPDFTNHQDAFKIERTGSGSNAHYVEREFGNWQYIDTGYRDFQEDLKKRFREVQFCINTLESRALKFNTAFVVDDVDKVPLYVNTVSAVTDITDPNYGTLFIDRELTDAVELPDITEFNAWELDTAMFPNITVYKIRYRVSGKGYGGAVKILSKNEVPFELLHINWVYRIMFAR